MFDLLTDAKCFEGVSPQEKGDEKMVSKEASIKRPVVVSIISALTLFLGLTGTFMAVLVAVSLSLSYLTIFWFIAGPLLSLSGYNLWKMKKWGAELAAIIYSFDLITSPFVFGLNLSYIFAGILDAISLVLLALSWEHLQPPSLLPHSIQRTHKRESE